MTGSDLILHSLETAVESLREVLSLEKNPVVRDAAIQRFEYTYDLCWKFLRRWLELEGHPEVTRFTLKELFRLGAERGLVASPESWFRYQQARNLTVHAYDERRAEEVYAVLGGFLADADRLLAELKRRASGGPRA